LTFTQNLIHISSDLWIISIHINRASIGAGVSLNDEVNPLVKPGHFVGGAVGLDGNTPQIDHTLIKMSGPGVELFYGQFVDHVQIGRHNSDNVSRSFGGHAILFIRT